MYFNIVRIDQWFSIIYKTLAKEGFLRFFKVTNVGTTFIFKLNEVQKCNIFYVKYNPTELAVIPELSEKYRGR
jgi:hypothetical protein